MSPQLRSQSLKDLAAGPTRLGIFAAVSLAVTLLFMLYTSRSLIGLILTAATSNDTADGSADVQPDLAADMRRYASGVDGRSLFFVPPAPPPARSIDSAQRLSGPAGPPTRYGGPAIVGMINQSAWFADGKRLKVGDAEQAGLTLLEISPPWTARVRWQGAEFTVTLFDRGPLLTPASAPTPALPAPAEPQPESPASASSEPASPPDLPSTPDSSPPPPPSLTTVPAPTPSSTGADHTPPPQPSPETR